MPEDFLTPPERALLVRLSTFRPLQRYLEMVCIDILTLITQYADHHARRETKISGRYEQAFQGALAEQFRLCCSSGSAHRSGSVFEKDVHSVLLHGNVRERCTIIAMILTRKPHLVCFALQNPAAFPTICPKQASILLKDKNTVCNGKLVREHTGRETHNAREQIWKYACKAQQSNREVFSRRLSRKLDRFDLKRLGMTTRFVCPALSYRELQVLEASIKNDELRSWQTGHMNWKVDPECELAVRARELGEPMVAGISGHTDQLLQALRIFTYFDLRLATLASVLWLVGCDHHSCLEVLATAEFFGLEREDKPSTERIQALVGCWA